MVSFLEGFAGGFTPAFQRSGNAFLDRRANAKKRQLEEEILSLQAGGLRQQQDIRGQEAQAAQQERERGLNADLMRALNIQNVVDAGRQSGQLTEQDIDLIGAAGGGDEQFASLNQLLAGPSEQDIADLDATRAQTALRQAQTQKALRPDEGPALPTDIRTLQALGIKPTLEGVKDLAQAKSTKVNVGTGPKPPAGYTFRNPEDPKQGVDAIPGGPADPANPKNFQENQRKVATTSRRMQFANDKIKGLEEQGFNPAATEELGPASIPFVGTYFESDERKAYNSWAYSWTDAMLRATTGAQAPEAEVLANVATHFPQRGDGPGQVKQKRELREEQEKIFRQQAGGALQGEEDNLSLQDRISQMTPDERQARIEELRAKAAQ